MNTSQVRSCTLDDSRLITALDGQYEEDQVSHNRIALCGASTRLHLLSCVDGVLTSPHAAGTSRAAMQLAAQMTLHTTASSSNMSSHINSITTRRYTTAMFYYYRLLCYTTSPLDDNVSTNSTMPAAGRLPPSNPNNYSTPFTQQRVPRLAGYALISAAFERIRI